MYRMLEGILLSHKKILLGFLSRSRPGTAPGGNQGTLFPFLSGDATLSAFEESVRKGKVPRLFPPSGSVSFNIPL